MLNPGWPLGVLFFVFIFYIFQVPFPPHPPLWVVESKILVPFYFNFFLSFMQVGQQKIVEAFQHCYCSVAKSCLTLCHPMDCIMPGFPALHHLLKFAHIQAHWVGNSIQPSHLLLLLLLLPSVFLSIRVFSNELALRIRWPTLCSFSFSNSPSNEY